MITIRRVRREDLPSILRIERGSFGRDAWNRAAFLDYLAVPDRSLFLCAMDGGAIAGYVLAARRGIRAEVDSIAVAPRHRGRGLAAVLLKRALAQLRRQGVRTVSLNVRLENKAAIR
ncbi:MAG TPA: GNAT family N-acetyltransferase, partial [Bryobacteraceae bacterium]|nr:GNAT family N-acetyltransferase [Bryobacteraceae bacterium]